MRALGRVSIAIQTAAWLLTAAAASADPVREAVEAGNRAFATAFAAGDATGVAALYTEDGMLLPPGAARVDGREAIAAFWQSVMDGGTKAVTLETVQVESAGDLAYEVGAARLTGADESVSEARYVVVWKRAGERWLLHRDIWNAGP